MIRAAQDVPGGFRIRTDVCVIGSGAGGGVAAAVLAEGGREVVVLEEGPHVPGSRMTQREEQMYPLLYRDGGNQLTDDGGVNVLQGRVIGGSTVVNMADVVPIPDAVLAHWARHFGVSRYSVEQVREADRACSDAIGAHRIAPEQLNRNNRLLQQGGRALGLRGETFVHNRVGCVGSGYCLIGCAYDAKRSVALTFLPRALRTGRALVQSEARVSHLERDGDRVVAAVGQVIDHRSGKALAPFRVQADVFVVAAGAIHTPLILQASGLGGREVGAHLSLQPQAPVAALFPEPVVAFRGIPQAAWLAGTERADPDQGLGGFVLEGVSATPGMSAVSTALGPDALDALMTRFRHMAACLCLVPDRPAGRVTADRHGRPRIRYPLTAPVRQRLTEAIRTAARVYLAAGAEAVVLPFPDLPPVHSVRDLEALDRHVIRAASTPLISAHPQGTCRMGPDPRAAVVGNDLRVHGAPNVYVMDASVFPTTASAHIMLPVMSFAWLAAHDLLEAR